jgi:hypothetical protein
VVVVGVVEVGVVVVVVLVEGRQRDSSPTNLTPTAPPDPTAPKARVRSMSCVAPLSLM